jgi:mannose-6-phosphate isomerase
VHALGDGLVVLEVQQTSDATFRLYDWGRVDSAGKPRPLHREAGLACLKERPAGAGRQSPQLLHDEHGGQRLVNCDYFQLNRFSTESPLPLPAPCIWVGLNGAAAISSHNGASEVQRGRALLIPACLQHGTLQPLGKCEGVLVTWKHGATT